MNFIKSPQGQNIIWLDYCGYHLARTQNDLTPLQAIILYKGRLDLYKTMNDTSNTKKHQHKNLKEYDSKYGKFQKPLR